ncbi:hypothetical protein K439DRAFT_1622436 [Ramaria rubella]|nr:hypothetical protein K439DRAFT_1622436 [Ramaria rubella]
MPPTSPSSIPATPMMPRLRRIKDTPVQPPPDTPMNRARVDRQCEEWLATHPGGHLHAGSGYPLGAGTSPATPDVCSHCGKPETATHNMFLCQNKPLEQCEQQYCRNVYARNKFARTPATPGSPTPLFWVEMETGDREEIGEEEMLLMLENSEAGKGQEVEQ